MFLIFLLLTIAFDILLFKMLTYKKKDEKELKNFTMKEFNALVKLGDDYFE